MITDHQYREFMDTLAAYQRGKNGLNLSEWENDFIHSYMRSPRPSLWFTDPRREATDKMWRRYGPELNFPHPLDAVTERPKLPSADPDCCQFLVRDDAAAGGRQHPCNEPATCREPGKLLYCDVHGKQAKRAMERLNRPFALVSIPRVDRDTSAI